MAKIFGQDLTKRELMKRIGDISQIAGARQSILSSGKAEGVHAIDVKTGAGLNYSIIPSRGMDIAWTDFNGMAIGYISPTGVTSPAYFEPAGRGFLRSFYGGLLTTCGLTYMGADCNDEGTELGIHGRISNTPAEDVCVTNEWENDEFIMKIRGKMRESTLFGENIVQTREIKSKLGENIIQIKDRIENCGFKSQPLMLLYHFNFGFPLLDKSTKLILPEGTIRPRDLEAEKGLNDYEIFTEPVQNYSEQVFYHDLKQNEGNKTIVKIINDAHGTNGVEVYLKFDKVQLPNFVQWKMTGEGEYVLGLEPSTWFTEGRKEARRKGELKFIEPGEVLNFDLEIGVGYT
jgi:hypothetical protein